MRAKVNLTEHTNCKILFQFHLRVNVTSFVCENLKWERGWGDPELKKTLSFRCLRRKRLKEALSPCLS